ncbi:MAG: hypothetical protein ACO1SX_28450 [Actinomycetota bacterium]
MAKRKKTWREKLADAKGLPKVEAVSGRMSQRWGEGSVAIPAPLEIDALMRQVPEGKLTTINELREAVAEKHGATFGCPITSGIFAWIAAHAADEAAGEGETDITPYWRTLKNGGELNPKYPGGLDALKQRLEAEGQTVVTRGQRMFVQGYAERLAALAVER